MKQTPVTIEVLSLPGCPNTGETLRVAGEVVLSTLPGTQVRGIRLTEAQALERGFPGSPTVLVNGRDIEGREPHAAGAA